MTKGRSKFLAGFGLAAAAIVAMGQVAIQTFPPNTVFGRIGVGQYGPGAAIPLSTLAANLGIGVTAHSVPIGKGTTTTGFNSAATGTAGQLLVDQGAGNDPAFVPMTGSCTLAANGAVACGTTGGGVTAVTADYTAIAGDCSKTIAAGGNLQITITLNSAASYGACTIDISNVDTWGSGRGKVLSITGLTTNPPVLYPGMTATFVNVGGVWFQKPGIATTEAPIGTRLYVDAINGSNSNDCLAALQSCRSLNHVIMGVIWKYLTSPGGSGTGGLAGFDVRLISNPTCIPSTGVNCHAALHMSGTARVEGHNSITIECDSGSAVNCSISDMTGNQAIGMYCYCFLELKNVTLYGGASQNNNIQAEKGMIRLQSGVVLGGGSGSTTPMMSALDHGTIILEGATLLTVSGNGGFLAQTSRYGVIALDQGAVFWTGNSTFAQQTLSAGTGSSISAVGTSWQTNGFTITTTTGFNISCGPGGIVATGGAIASVPGTNAQSGCSASGNGQVN